MDISIENNNLQIDYKQAEMIAYNVFKDIESYIKDNIDEFIQWLLLEIFEEFEEKFIITFDWGIMEKRQYHYKLCDYK